MARGLMLSLAAVALGCGSPAASRPAQEPAVSVPAAPANAAEERTLEGPSAGRVQAVVLDPREGGELIGAKVLLESLERCHRPNRAVGWVMLRARWRGESWQIEIVDQAGVAPAVASCLRSALGSAGVHGMPGEDALVYVRLE